MKRAELIARAIGHTMFEPTTLKRALERLGFVQADPLRSPARAQDLILRQRVIDYRAGALEQAYPTLELEEEYLYAYGFMQRSLAALLHPRAFGSRLSALDRRVLELVRASATVHPRELDAHLGRKRVRNAWGGYSQATKRALEHLHQRGLVRIGRREQGVRVYQRVPPVAQELSADERLGALAMVVANVLSPVAESTLQRITAHLRRWFPKATDARSQLAHLLSTGELVRDQLDGVKYLWPASAAELAEPARRVRLLAPFDPLVWDRARFEQLWGWAYRFEAYTPLAKRVRGYYALPLLWRDCVVGWANASTASGALEVELGFVKSRPKERDFNGALEAEIERLRVFLGP